MKTILCFLLSAFCFSANSASLLGIAGLPMLAATNPPAPPAEASLFITNQTVGTLRNNLTNTVGYAFVMKQTVTCTHVGRFVFLTNSAVHSVTIRNGGNCAILASNVVDLSGSTNATWVWAEVTPNLTLTNGSKYRIMSAEVGGQDKWSDNDTTVQPDLSVGGVSYPTYGVCTDGGTTNHSFGLVNFKFTIP